MRRVIQIGGSIIFILSLCVSVLFAEGYQYDVKARDFVQKGVIYFEDIGKAQLFINGREVVDFKSPGEVRLTPAIYELEVRQEGYHTWKKKVVVSLSRVVRFAPIQLVKTSGSSIVRSVLAPTSSWQLHSFDAETVLLRNQDLHIEKEYTLRHSPEVEVRNVFSETNPIFDASLISNFPASFTIEESFHVLVMNKDKTLMLCDRDRENCHQIATLDTPQIHISRDNKNFLVQTNGFFTLLHFGAPAFPDQLRSFLFE